MQMRKPAKISIFLLIAILLTTGLGSAYGFVACDHGCLSDIHHDNHHQGEEADEDIAVPYYPLASQNEDACRDFLIQLSACVIEESEILKSPELDIFPATSVDSSLFSARHIPVSSFHSSSLLIMSQTRLVQRTGGRLQ